MSTVNSSSEEVTGESWWSRTCKRRWSEKRWGNRDLRRDADGLFCYWIICLQQCVCVFVCVCVIHGLISHLVCVCVLMQNGIYVTSLSMSFCLSLWDCEAGWLLITMGRRDWDSVHLTGTSYVTMWSLALSLSLSHTHTHRLQWKLMYAADAYGLQISKQDWNDAPLAERSEAVTLCVCVCVCVCG